MCHFDESFSSQDEKTNPNSISVGFFYPKLPIQKETLWVLRPTNHVFIKSGDIPAPGIINTSQQEAI